MNAMKKTGCKYLTSLMAIVSNRQAQVHVDTERMAARKLLKDLQSFLRTLNFFRSPLEVDLAIQEFASDYCQSNATPFRPVPNKIKETRNWYQNKYDSWRQVSNGKEVHHS